jgi:hypothetical protein
MGIKSAVYLLLTGTACQLVVNVDAYQFELSDASAGVAPLEPPGSSSAPAEPLDPAIGDAAAPAAPNAPEPGADDGNTAGTPPGAPPDEGGGESETSPGQSEAEPEPFDSGPEPPPSGAEPEPADPEPEPSPSEPLPPHPMYGCSLIEFCYAYEVEDTTDEERCIQSGCSLEDASAECRREIAELCGIAPLPPFVLVTLTGERVILN